MKKSKSRKQTGDLFSICLDVWIEYIFPCFEMYPKSISFMPEIQPKEISPIDVLKLVNHEMNQLLENDLVWKILIEKHLYMPAVKNLGNLMEGKSWQEAYKMLSRAHYTLVWTPKIVCAYSKYQDGRRELVERQLIEFMPFMKVSLEQIRDVEMLKPRQLYQEYVSTVVRCSMFDLKNLTWFGQITNIDLSNVSVISDRFIYSGPCMKSPEENHWRLFSLYCIPSGPGTLNMQYDSGYKDLAAICTLFDGGKKEIKRELINDYMKFNVIFDKGVLVYPTAYCLVTNPVDIHSFDAIEAECGSSPDTSYPIEEIKSDEKTYRRMRISRFKDLIYLPFVLREP